MMKLSSGNGASKMSPAGPRGNTALSPRSASNRSSGPVTPCCASSVACMPFWAISALAMFFAAEMPPSRTATGVAARAALSAIPCASLSLGQPHQPAGDGRRDHTGNADAVPHRVRIHQCFAAAVDFVSEHDGGEEIASGRLGQLGGGERDRNIVARMAAAGAALRVRADHIVVEIEDADQRAVGEHRARRAHAMGMAEHRALRFLAERVERRQHRTGAVIIQRGKTAAERIEQQELGPLDGALRKILGTQCREPCGKPLDGAFV